MPRIPFVPLIVAALVGFVSRSAVRAQAPARVTEMAAKWEAWARRTGVLPWIWKPPYRSPDPRARARRSPVAPVAVQSSLGD